MKEQANLILEDPRERSMGFSPTAKYEGAIDYDSGLDASFNPYCPIEDPLDNMQWLNGHSNGV